MLVLKHKILFGLRRKLILSCYLLEKQKKSQICSSARTSITSVNWLRYAKTHVVLLGKLTLELLTSLFDDSFLGVLPPLFRRENRHRQTFVLRLDLNF